MSQRSALYNRWSGLNGERHAPIGLMTAFFQFETDFVESLRCIPMQVRYNLDTCGVKLKLEHWNHFSPEQKQALVDCPCATPREAEAYREQLQAWVTEQTGAPAKTLALEEQPPWLNAAVIPEAVVVKATACDLAISNAQWENLDPLQRFVLIKLSRPSHENRNFVPAMREFGLV